eukprot:234760_1
MAFGFVILDATNKSSWVCDVCGLYNVEYKSQCQTCYMQKKVTHSVSDQSINAMPIQFQMAQLMFDNCIQEFLSFLEIKSVFYVMIAFPSYSSKISAFCHLKIKNEKFKNNPWYADSAEETDSDNEYYNEFVLDCVECFDMDWTNHSIKQQKISSCEKRGIFDAIKRSYFTPTQQWGRDLSEKLDQKWDQTIKNEYDTWRHTEKTSVIFQTFDNLEYEDLIKDSEWYGDVTEENERDLYEVIINKLCKHISDKNTDIISLKGYNVIYIKNYSNNDSNHGGGREACVEFSLYFVINNDMKNVNVSCFSFSKPWLAF